MSGEIVNINDLILEEEETKTSKGEIVSVDDLDFKSGKTIDFSTETQTTESNVMGSQSDDGSFELPQITKEETKLVEELGIRELQKKLSGLGFTFKESSLIFGDTKVFGYDISDLMPGSDYIIITSPPDADGNTVSEKFSFEAPDLKYRGDKKGIGYRGSAQGVADRINAFVNEHAKKSENYTDDGVDASLYANSWNYANKIAKEYDYKNLSSEEQWELSNKITDDLNNSSGYDSVKNQVLGEMKSFLNETAISLKKKHDINTEAGVNAFLEELEGVAKKEFTNRILKNPEYKRIKNTHEKAVQGFFSQDIPLKMREEGELEVMPNWVNKNPVMKNLVKGIYGTSSVKIPGKGYEFTALNESKKLEEITPQIEKYKNMNPDEMVFYNEGFSIDPELNIPTKKYKASELVELLENNSKVYTERITKNIITSKEYQDKLSKIVIPKLFDEEGFNVTGEEFWRMIGDQGVQMIGAALTLGGTTLLQEGGGAYTEITTAKAAMKMFPDMDKNDAITKFQKLPMEGKGSQTEAILDLIEKGEADLDIAFTIGATNAGLDLISNTIIIGKAAKFLPKSLARDFISRRYKEFLKGGWKSLGKDIGIGSFTEFLTETAQESVNIFGVGTATGEGISDMVTKENLVRLLESGGQALITTGPIIGGGQVVSTTAKEMVSRIAAAKNPDHQRNLVNAEKKRINELFEQGRYTQKERDQLFTDLEAVEQSTNFGIIETKKGRENVIKYKAQILKNEQEQKEIENNPTSKRLGVTPRAHKIRLEEIKKENEALENKVYQEVFASNFEGNGKGLAQFINETKEGPLKDYNIVQFEKLEDVIKAIEAGINKGEIKFDATQQEMFEQFKLGKDNALKIGKTAYLANDVIRKNNKKGDWSSTNAIHHEVLHMIFDSIDPKELISWMNKTQKLMEGSTDPFIQKVFPNFIQRYNQYFNDKNYWTGAKAGEGDMKPELVEEYFTSLSDAMQAVKLSNINVENGSLFNEMGRLLQDVFSKNTKGNIDFSNLNAENMLEFIKKYNNFNGKGPKYENIQFRGGTDVREPGVAFSKSASDKVQSIYDEQGEAGAFDIIEQFKPIVNKIVDKRSQAPNFDRQLLTDEIETGKRGIFDLIRAYPAYVKKQQKDGEKVAPLAGFINNMLPKRAIEASRRVLGEEFTEDVTEKVDIAAEEVTTETKAKPQPKKIVLADRLNVKSKVNETIKKQLPKLDVKNLTFKKLKNLVPETTGKLFGISPKKLKTLANITKPELQKAQMYISKNADLLLAMLPEGTTISGTSTGVPNTLLKAFYTKTDRAKLSKTGSASGLPVQVKNKNITKKQFLEVFGIIDGKPTRDDRNTSARVLALANLTGKMMTNQAVRENLELLGDSKQTIKNIREGAADVMFSKGISNLGLINFKKLINDPKNGIDNYDLFLDKMELLASYFPDRFIRRVDLYSWGITNENTKLYAREKTKELKDVFLMGQHPSGRVYLKPNADNALGTSIKGITKAKVKKYNDSGKANFDIMINSIKKAVKNNPNDIELHSAIYVYLSNSVQDTTHPLRGGAEYIGGDITATGQIIYEHAVQSARARDIIMDALLDKNQNFDETIKALKSNYKLIAMSKKDADQLKVTYYINEKGDLISYENGMGVGWDLFNDKFFDRYFNLDVNFINPNNFKLTKNNKTFAEEYSVTMSGRSPVIKSNLKGAKVLNNAISSSRSAFEKFQAQKQRGKKFVKDLKTRESFNKFQAQKQKAKQFVKDLKTREKFEKFQAQQREAEKFVESIRPQIRQSKGITILDFDDTLATTKSLVKYTAPDGTTGTLNAEQFASTYQDLQEQGYKFDFSDFNKVVKGKLAPLFQKALKLQNKFGPENMFVLTARPPQSQKAIFDFLKANGLNIPLKNITGLGNSTAEAKALWVADKVAEGYNDFYFADDALQNVQAVKNMLDQFDVKSKVQQAKVNFSKGMDSNFNKILQDVTGIEFKKRFSDIKARKRGEKKGRFRFFVPPSHEDFVGLLYNFMGKGRKGDQHRDFFEKALVRPLNRAYREIDTAKQAIANDYKALNKQFGGVKKKLRKKTPDGDFIFEDAIRVYLWNKHGYEIPGLSPTDQKNLVELVNNDAELKAYADAINIISKQDTYVDPGKGWEGGNIKTDLIDATGRVGREQYFAEFKENADIIFSPENLNKIEAAYGKDFRSALEDMLYRISTGINRPKGQSGTINKFMNYLNGSVGTVMFFNVRSAILQQMSIVNYINFADNNIFAAAKAFANQKQYWKDFAFIFNSDMLKQRRGGIGTDINGADLAQAVAGSKNPSKVVVSRLLQLGFLPTQIGDNIAIATGGATFYRNRINKYIKDGLSKKEAEAKAFTDFQDLTQSTQQSSRPDMTSQQQASWIGKLVLNFQNITSQYNRIIKKAALDIKNGRISPPYTTRTQSNLGNLSKILYYGGIQNVIFYSLQTALFAVMFDDDNDEDQILKKSERVINGSIDSILRGSGIYGAVISTLKNTLIKFKEQREKGYNKDESAVLMELLNFSPVVVIKARQIVNAEKTINYNENIMSEMETFDAENPRWSAVTNYTQALTNFPANRLYQKTLNMRNALDKDYTNFQRVLFFSGYTTWSLGLGVSEAIIEAKEKAKINKKNTKTRGRTRGKTRGTTR